MKNQAVAAGFQDGFKLAWQLGIAGVEVIDYRMSKAGGPRLWVAVDPRGPLSLPFGPPDIQNTERQLVGIRHAGCELVWSLQ